MNTDATTTLEPDVASRPTAKRIEVISLLTAAAAIAYLARNAVGVAESTIRDDVGLTLEQSGWFMGAFFWSYALLQVPTAGLAQRHGTRLMLFVYAIMWSAGALCIGMAPGLWLLIAAQLLMGAAQAGLFPAACYSVSHWIPLARRTFSCGCVTMGMQVGAIAASLLTGLLILKIGWRWVFALYSVPGILWAMLFLLRFRDDPQEDTDVNAAERELIQAGGAATPRSAYDKTPTPWGGILSSPSVFFLCAQQTCRAAGYIFFASWFPTFLQKTRGVSVEESGYLQAVVFTGTLVGALCGGLLTDWIWQRTKSLNTSRSGVGITFLTGCALLVLAAWFVDNTVLAVVLLAVGAFFAALAGPGSYSAAIDIGGTHVPQVFGLMNMCGNLGAFACPILVGQLFAATKNWDLVLLVFAGIYLASAVCWAFVDCNRSVSS